MTRPLPGPYEPEQIQRFLETFMYDDRAFLIDEVVGLHAERHEIEARLDTTRPLPFVAYQRARPGHPAHVSGAELIMVTADLGSLHAWFFHGLRWDEGWVGYGNRIHRADFKTLAAIGPPLELRSREIRVRKRSNRIVIRFEFDFSQAGQPVYFGDQTAMFLRPDATR